MVDGNDSAIVDILRSPDLAHLRIQKSHLLGVLTMLKKSYREKESSTVTCPWIPYSLTDGSKVYLNLANGGYQWEKPEEVVMAHQSRYLTLVDLEDAVMVIMQQEANNKRLDQLMVRLQARARGWLQRQRISRLKAAALAIQERQVVVIQRAWRAHKARVDLRSLTHQANPPLSVICKFIHLLDVSEKDLDEEFKLQRTKSDMVKTIRHTHQLETQVDELDVKIGLLVHNRITLQDVLPADKENVNPNVPETKTRRSRKGSKDTLKYGSMRTQRGLKAFKKESREKLLSYQHLFYLLQTQPHYLATLIFAIPPGKTTKFIENVIFTLYNYGANDRDNFLLLKLFKTALEEEIRCKVLRLSDIVSGNPLVVKMIVSFNRKGAGQASLRDMLGPLIHRILGDSGMQINTNPVDIYKSWINQLEMHSGQASGLPYTVNQDQALQYPEVQKRLAQAITTLKEVTLAFCDQITTNRDVIPYAMLYMAKVMRQALQRRFPHIPEKEILKVVGNLVYYRYINSAIVAPDAFDIVTVSPDQKLNNNQRRNLASIAKILQFAASKKGFGDEAITPEVPEPFIIECHEKFKNFFRHCCEVEEPETVYNVTQYSEANAYCQTHHLHHNPGPDERIIYRKSVRPTNSCWTMRRSLPQTATTLSMSYSLTLGRDPSSPCPRGRGSSRQDGKCVWHSSTSFDVTETAEEKDSKDSNKMFSRTKQLLVDVLRCVEGSSIGQLVTGPTLSPQEERYRSIIHTRTRQEHQAQAQPHGTQPLQLLPC
ncbi:Ras GTPase-activating-like protein IQGAP2 [Penaeus vannamei]|uniref:Ras GTPase-activating-like protein IQGAP2 n=1 Tax=Penaeus vannamei TaxID=6689 RepID=A0A3R7P5I4_PENVA|nr:Ras GTPase-activating-like protein IQGAP2 [Penaeus vannamei]